MKVIESDAFGFAENQTIDGQYDMVFTYLRHDVTDDMGLYLKMKQYEDKLPTAIHSYWIEKSIFCYL